ncbi:hypothetical protein A2696_01395 [Candidatus Curtissbacteria bacterium RIFCSPHIGHO2_01_FULL_41_13]|uniref:Transport permease protein n=1 Tax=Candidatus Curtissbacteria bacterium RIFCSPHIGHO2_01_FULL_41_13 TaxID=1797745 RepID=A0A1F5FY48_9BACT|nr:MAG: hypothetical protein A2696_01395 [Candidatus Curtissbacteria bacterium RIFCSPHIGHO2_01_FULL_41_13]
MNPRRIYALVLRHYFLSIHQLERFFDAFLYPALILLLWGFLSSYIGNIKSSGLIGFLLGGLILWVIFERVNTDLGLSFMYDVWERNIINVLSSPLTFVEFIAGLVLVGLSKIVFSFILMAVMAAVFYNFQVTTLGFSLVLFAINLIIFAWSFGIFNLALIFRFGHSIGPITWILPFLLQPFSAVFYPISILPSFWQNIAHLLPIAYVFEGMRTLLTLGIFDYNQFLISLALNIVYLGLAIGFFYITLNSVKKSGRLVKLI